MKKVLFRYRRGSAFGTYLDKDRSIEVYEADGKCFFEFTPGSRDEKLTHHIIELSEETNDRIKTVYSENPGIYKIEDVEFPPILDGSDHGFTFADNEHSVELSAFNIWYYANDYEGERAVNAELVLTVYSEVAEILIEAGVEKELLML